MQSNAQPVVSVALITYNHEAHIAQALESAIGQKTTFPFEIIVGEDCSTDNTRAIVREYQERYPNLVRALLPDRNQGPFKNVAVTLNACRGKYIAALEGDDYWTSDNKLQRQVDFFETHPECSICFHKVLVLDETGEQPSRVIPEKAKTISTLEDLLPGNFIPSCSAIWRRGLFEKLPDWVEEVKFSDWVIHVLNAEHGHIGFVDDCMAVYRLHAGGTWSTQSWHAVMTRWITAYERMNEYFGGRYEPIFKRAIFMRRYGFAIDCVERATPDAREHVWNALRSEPAMTCMREKATLATKFYAPGVIRLLGRVKRGMRPRAL
jgi:glycosyltransferase involved in cell wall biosynthesis